MLDLSFVSGSSPNLRHWATHRKKVGQNEMNKPELTRQKYYAPLRLIRMTSWSMEVAATAVLGVRPSVTPKLPQTSPNTSFLMKFFRSGLSDRSLFPLIYQRSWSTTVSAPDRMALVRILRL
jgi:hypothetical protein